MADRDIYSRNVKYGGAFSADGVTVTFNAPGVQTFSSGMLVQQLTWQYAQQMSRVYDVMGPDVYVVAGRTQGQAGIETILGPKRLLREFYVAFGDVCNIASNRIHFSAVTACGDGGRDGTFGSHEDILLDYVVIESMSGAVRAENMLIQNNINMMFLRQRLPPARGNTTGLSAAEQQLAQVTTP